MKNCLVTKLKDAVNNSNLRKLNELTLRFTNIESVERTQLSSNKFSSSETLTEDIEYNITGGAGYFSTSNDPSEAQKRQSIKTRGNVNLWVTGEYVDVTIKNFDLVCDCLGFNNGFLNEPTFYPPLLSLNLSEINRSFIKGLNCSIEKHSRGIYGNIANLSYCTALEIVNLSDIDNQNLYGNLSSLSRLNNLRVLKLGSIGSTQKHNISYSLSDIANLASVEEFVISGGNCYGGDIFSFVNAYKNRTLNVTVARTGSATPYSCSYTTGATIQPFTLNTLKFNASGSLSSKVLDSLLDMFIDGITNNVITVAENAYLSVSTTNAIWNSFSAKRDQLTGFGVTLERL